MSVDPKRWLLVVPVLTFAALFVAGAAARTPVRGPWDGKWSTSHGTMTLTQKGSHVTGTYAHDDGRIVGTAIGHTLSGRWSEEPTYAGPGDAGTTLLQMDQVGLQFTGRWTYADRTPGGKWSGIRAET